jgi:hexosaminidase
MRRHGLRNEQELQSWFVRRIERFLVARGRRLIGWDEILDGGLAPQATVMSWRGVDGGIAAARQGNDVIMSPGSHLYFDHAQGEPALEPLSIGGNTPLARVYEFEPVPPALTDTEARHILGAQANLWTEYITTPKHAEYMVFPRLLALAEVVWSPKEAREWSGFRARLPGQLRALDRQGVNYRVPHVEGLEADRLTLSDTAVVELGTLLPESSEIRYTLDSTAPARSSTLYAGPLRLSVARGPVTVTAAVFTPDGRASPIRRARFIRTSLRAAERVDEQRLRRGLSVAYYAAKFDSAKALSRGTPTSTGASDSIGFQGIERPENFGLRFSGYLRVAVSGLYTITLASDDGSVLRIGDRIVVDNDGWHSETERSGMIALEGGLHPVSVEFVQGGGGRALSAFIQREGGARMRLAGEMLARMSP